MQIGRKYQFDVTADVMYAVNFHMWDAMGKFPGVPRGPTPRRRAWAPSAEMVSTPEEVRQRNQEAP